MSIGDIFLIFVVAPLILLFGLALGQKFYGFLDTFAALRAISPREDPVQETLNAATNTFKKAFFQAGHLDITIARVSWKMLGFSNLFVIGYEGHKNGVALTRSQTRAIKRQMRRHMRARLGWAWPLLLPACRNSGYVQWGPTSAHERLALMTD